MIVISDTSPITNLIKIGRLNILHDLFGKVVVPEEVNRELLNWKKLGADISTYQNAPWIELAKVKVTEYQLRAHLSINLDDGEADAIALAFALKADFLLIDERRGRKIARSMGIKAVGLIGVLLEAKNNGVIEEVLPILESLRTKAGFWISEDLFNQVKLRARE